MILQRLHDDCDIILRQASSDGGGLPPSGFVPKPVRWYIQLLPGTSPEIQSLGSGDKKDKGQVRLLPECKRAGTVIRPFLLSDVATYVLGVNRDEKKVDTRLAAKHEAFVKLARACADNTENLLAIAVADLLEDSEAMTTLLSKLPTALDATHNITFQVNGKYVVDEPDVQAFWARVAAGGDNSDSEQAEGTQVATDPICLLSGVRGPVEEMMPITVKGLMGGNPTGTHLVSGNFAAMESHGWKRSQTSPISRAAGERFGQALNALLASDKHRRRFAASTYVFWAGEGTSAIDLPIFADVISTETVRNLLDAMHTGKRYYIGYDQDTPFYTFGLLPNVARIAVRSALSLTVGELEQAQANWFERLKIQAFDENGQPTTLRPLPIKTLAVAGYREFKDIPPGIEDALVRCALLGVRQAPLPVSLLHAVVMRSRVEQEVKYPRAALLKFILTQDKELEIAKLMENEVVENLPDKFTPVQNTAYHLGRLFAELEAIQGQAIPGANATIADRFYGSASSTPASVFGILLDGVQNHLGKLRNDKNRAGAFAGAQKRLEEILALIDGFPKTLTLPDQAMFSLGYYHHRAAKRKEISEKSAAKRAAQVTNTTTDITEIQSEGDEN